MARRDPDVPDFVHGGEIGDIAQPDRGRQDLRLVAAAFGQQRVDLGQRLADLAGDVGARILGDHARAMDAVAQDDGLAHARAAVDSGDAAHGGEPKAPFRLAQRTGNALRAARAAGWRYSSSKPTGETP